jgi:Lon protease-like protein
VANRWCEILPISSAAKQRLMALDEPVLRLQLVQDYLQGKGLL